MRALIMLRSNKSLHKQGIGREPWDLRRRLPSLFLEVFDMRRCPTCHGKQVHKRRDGYKSCRWCGRLPDKKGFIALLWPDEHTVAPDFTEWDGPKLARAIRSLEMLPADDRTASLIASLGAELDLRAQAYWSAL